jgi:hypothetical protein
MPGTQAARQFWAEGIFLYARPPMRLQAGKEFETHKKDA